MIGKKVKKRVSGWDDLGDGCKVWEWNEVGRIERDCYEREGLKDEDGGGGGKRG
jgi:hypothetical protein